MSFFVFVLASIVLICNCEEDLLSERDERIASLFRTSLMMRYVCIVLFSFVVGDEIFSQAGLFCVTTLLSCSHDSKTQKQKIVHNL